MKHWNDITKAQRIERWENVLRVLRAMTPHERKRHFDMSSFGYTEACGTVACAAGHCGLDTWFRRRGFSITITEGGASPTLQPGWLVNDMVTSFFGHTGTVEIFYNGVERPVSTVIREVKDFVKALKANAEMTE